MTLKKLSLNWSTKQFNTMTKGGTISFDYPIQRKGEQWDDLQKSLLIHSMVSDYPVPALYSVAEKQKIEGKEKNVYFILDGKQRLTNVTSFLDDEYALHLDTPSVKVDDGVEETKHEIAELKFSELPEVVQDKLLSFSLQIYKLEDASDEEIEDMFFRLNNGTPLSKQQKAKAKMGASAAGAIKELTEHQLMTDNAHFTEFQLRKADDETVLIQSMMILDDTYELQSFSSNDVFDYSLTLKKDKGELFNTVKSSLDFMNEAFGLNKEKSLLKKVFFPMTIAVANEAINESISPEMFIKWTLEFKNSLKQKDGSIETNYKDYAGAGSAKRENVEGRLAAIKSHFEAWLVDSKAVV